MHGVSEAIGEAAVGVRALVTRPPQVVGTLIVGIVNVGVILLHYSLSLLSR